MLSYFKKNGIEYAKTQGKSVRVGSKVIKENQKHIGRVIDKENHVFYSRDRGIFTYDENTDTYGKADESYSSVLKTDKRKREKLLLDFGDGKIVNLYLDRQIFSRLENYCDETGQTKTTAVERMLSKELNQYFEQPEDKRVPIK